MATPRRGGNPGSELGAGREGAGARADGRGTLRMRPIRILRGVLAHAEGSALIRIGRTQVLCAASVEERVPVWLRGRGQGWLTAEYGMLPCSVPNRAQRGKTSGRSFEIQRLIGRSLRAVTDLSVLGDRTITIDCDVIEADGGTRVASITAGWIALHDCVERLREKGLLKKDPLKDRVAAVSVGLVDGAGILDLSHSEDSRAQVDLNVVGTAGGLLVEVQGAAEGDPFREEDLRMLVRIGRRGLAAMLRAQEKALARPPSPGVDLVKAP
ncbi:MAG: ribonuclease PH [Candidatus Eisenbacteria bacterium]|nr:ribonuclease PH [Candidatus Eisenbacteria bacterium]